MENPLLCASVLDHLLFMPIVDLMNVSEHDLVFALHVIRNPLLLHPAHVALQRHGESKDVVTRETMAWTSNMWWHNLRGWHHPQPLVYFLSQASTLRMNMWMAVWDSTVTVTFSNYKRVHEAWKGWVIGFNPAYCIIIHILLHTASYTVPVLTSIGRPLNLILDTTVLRFDLILTSTTAPRSLT